MLALLQRVVCARVWVEEKEVAAIDAGLLVFLGVEKGDGEIQADRLLGRILGYRIFPDQEGKMNLSLADRGGGLLLVPQFTLAADTRKGLRPSFSPAAAPAEGQRLFAWMTERACRLHAPVAAGCFGAHMQVELRNDGPVTFLLRAPPQGFRG
jgi:D-tyrosyl-tRNA(Tyr) deacylase